MSPLGSKRPTRGHGGPPYHPPIWSCSGWGLHSQLVA